MPLLFGRIRGRQALAWLKHRRWWIVNEHGGGGDPGDTRITADGFRRVTADASVRVVRPSAIYMRLEEDDTPRLEENGINRYTEAA